MKRSLLLGLLQEYRPATDEERHAQERMIDFIKTYENCFERSLAVGHITGSAWLLSKDGSQALLTHHAKLGMWLQLGGHCDGDHDVVRVALREAQEESGIADISPLDGKIFDIDIHLIPDNGREPEHYHYDVRFLMQVLSDDPAVPNRETKELRWIGKDLRYLPAQSNSIMRMFHKWLQL